MRTVADVIAATRRPGEPLPAPAYAPELVGEPVKIAFMVESMRRHTTNEGYELALAFQAGGYYLSGFGYDGVNDVAGTLNYMSPDIAVIQDKREWVGRTGGAGFDHRESFRHADELRRRSDIFTGTVIKDAHTDHALHVEAAREIGAHFWVTYYHPDIVAAQAPFLRREHIVRTWHSVDPAAVPAFQWRDGAGILSGAVSGAYPLRSRLALAANNGQLKHIRHHKHPGYHRAGCYTPEYLRALSMFRVSVCTSSRFGYAVRKIVESVAAGCVVVTDLPSDDVLPEIDGNLVRVDPDISPARVDALVGDLAATWDADRQREWAARALRYYDYRALGKRLAADIETLRGSYAR